MAATAEKIEKSKKIQRELMVEVIAEANKNPDWLLDDRLKAWRTFGRTPLPSRVTHLWRYTAPETFLRPGDGLGAVAPHGDPVIWPSCMVESLEAESLGAAAYNLDGSAIYTALDHDLDVAGVHVRSLHDAARNMPGIVQEHLGTLVGADFGKFEAEINALWTGGLLVYVPHGVHVDKPIHLLTTSPADGQRRLQRLLVVLEEDATLNLIDEYGTGAGGGQAGVVVELVVGNGARLQYVPVQNWHTNTVSYMTQRAKLGADAFLETILISTGSGTGKFDGGAVLAGRGARSEFYGLAIGDGKQHYDHHTVHHHRAENTGSDLKFKVALRDKANSVYTGLIRIDEDSPNCEAYQENRNLLLSTGVRAESIPELEILNKEVRCSHGATVGKIEPEEIFYLQSRGIGRQEAIRLIVGGFVAPIVERIPEVARERITEMVARRLPGG